MNASQAVVYSNALAHWNRMIAEHGEERMYAKYCDMLHTVCNTTERKALRDALDARDVRHYA